MVKTPELQSAWTRYCHLLSDADKLQEKSENLSIRGNKLWCEIDNLSGQPITLWANASALWAESGRLWGEAAQLKALAVKIWATAVQQEYGDISVRWRFGRGSQCILENGDIYTTDND